MRANLLCGVLAAITAVNVASAAPNLVQNGSFETSSYAASSEFGASFGGQGVTGWMSASASAFNAYFISSTATTVSEANRFADPGNKISTAFTGSSPDGGNFVTLDGDTNFNGALTQSVSGLTAGANYEVSFSGPHRSYRTALAPRRSNWS